MSIVKCPKCGREEKQTFILGQVCCNTYMEPQTPPPEINAGDKVRLTSPFGEGVGICVDTDPCKVMCGRVLHIPDNGVVDLTYVGSTTVDEYKKAREEYDYLMSN